MHLCSVNNISIFAVVYASKHCFVRWFVCDGLQMQELAERARQANKVG